MGLITERDGAAGGYEVVTIPPAPGEAAVYTAAGACASPATGKGVPVLSGTVPGDIAAGGTAAGGTVPGGTVPRHIGAGETAKAATAAAPGSGSVAVLRRRSALPSRRSVLYLHCQRDMFVPEDLVSWYTERGFHFYVADLRPQEGLDSPPRRRRGPGRGECFARLDAACRYLRETEGIDMTVVSAHSAGALTAAQWCDARREAGLADALILSSPAFGRRLRRGADIACPVLVLSRVDDRAAVRLGQHVTWLRLDDGLDWLAGPDLLAAPRQGRPGTQDVPDVQGVPGALGLPGARRTADAGDAGGAGGADRRRFFDEMGRWLGAYMYGSVRDQLL